MASFKNLFDLVRNIQDGKCIFVRYLGLRAAQRSPPDKSSQIPYGFEIDGKGFSASRLQGPFSSSDGSYSARVIVKVGVKGVRADGQS